MSKKINVLVEKNKTHRLLTDQTHLKSNHRLMCAVWSDCYVTLGSLAR